MATNSETNKTPNRKIGTVFGCIFSLKDAWIAEPEEKREVLQTE
jgi:hypothetical protein